MTRILDVDLDFFVSPAAHFRSLDDLTRLDDDEYQVWSPTEACAFLEHQCGLTTPLPGWAIERHGEAFDLWGRALADGEIAGPLSVTHIDAHADLGLGEPVHLEIMGELMFMPVEDRAARASSVSDGSYLAFACASGWLSDLTYVYSDDGGNDLHPYHMKDWDLQAASLQLKAVRLDTIPYVGVERDRKKREVDRVDPEIPFRRLNWRQFRAEENFDAMVICRSPNFTPPAADPVYDAICDRFLSQSSTVPAR